MKIIKLFLIICFFSVGILNAAHFELTKEEQSYIASKPIIKVSNELDWYPYDFNENNEASGYAVDYFKLLAEKIGLHVEFTSDKWPNLVKKFKNKELDVIYPAKKTESRQKFAIFSNKFISTKTSLIAQGKRDDINSIEDMAGKTLAVGKGWASGNYIKKNYKNIKIKEYDTSTEILEAVAFGLADAGLDDFLTANVIINKEMLSNLHVVARVEFNKSEKNDLYILFQKDNHILQGLFNKALEHINEQELLEIKSKWIFSVTKKKDILDFTVDEKNYLKKKKIIKMCIDPNWMPFEMNDSGVHVGMSKDYMELIEEKINTSIEMVSTKTWQESIAFAKSRKCDIFSLAMPTPERELYMSFTKPYLHVPLVLTTKLDEIFYSNISAITDKKMGIVKGYAYGEILRVKYPDMKLVDVKDIDDGLTQVEKGKLFGFIGTLATVGYKIQKEHVGNLKIAGKFDEDWELGVAVRNDEPLLLSVFEKAIASIDKSKHQQILNNWISVKYQKGADYSIFWKILMAILLVGIFILYRQNELKKYNKKLEVLSTTDKLTGAYNRLKLDEVLINAKNIFDRYSRNLSVIIFDIDDFKKVNDFFGHQVGDMVLKQITQIVLENKRNTDIFGRWGGEEFLLICYETDHNGASEVAEKLRKAINSYDFGEAKTQSASFGVAQFHEDESIEKVLDRADKELYKAKKSGKNMVFSEEK